MTPQDWARLAKENDRPDADGIFLSCTNTRQIEAIADIEKTLGKPVVNSNQAVLWGAVKRLSGEGRRGEADAAAWAIDGEFERLRITDLILRSIAKRASRRMGCKRTSPSFETRPRPLLRMRLRMRIGR